MPIFEFACPCGTLLTTSRPMTADTLHKTHNDCGSQARRVFSTFAFKRFVPHVSMATGQPVSSERQFREQLKVASDEATERTGIPHSFVPLDMRDYEPKNRDGLEETNRKHRELGWTERKRSYFT